MKKILITFFILLSLFAFLSCKNEPESLSDNKSVEQRDENGHLTQIDYYKNGSIYKTEYYEYLNKYDDESRLVKTVENDQVTYEMEECWKIAYALQNNTYKGFVEEQGQSITDERTLSFNLINNNLIRIIRTLNSSDSGVYYCENMIYVMDFSPNVNFQILDFNFQKKEFYIQADNFWTFKEI